MLFTVTADNLAEAYGLVQKAIPSRAVTEILKTVYIEALEPDTLILRGTNQILDITSWVPANVNTPGSCCVDPVILDAALRFGDGDIKFSLKKRLVVSKGRRRHMTPVVPGDQYPKAQVIRSWVSMSPEQRQDLASALARTQLAVSSGAGNPILQSYYIQPDGGFIATGDGAQVATFDLDLGRGGVATPPAKHLASIIGYIGSMGEEPFEVSFGSWTGFRSEKWEIQVNSFAGEFPAQARAATQSAVHGNPASKVTLNKDSFLSSLQLCKIYSTKAYALGHRYDVSMSFDGERANLTMDVPDLAEIDEPIDVVEFVGATFENLRYNPSLTLEAVSGIEGDKLEFWYFGPEKPFLILDPADERFIYLQLSMRTTKSGSSTPPPPPPAPVPTVHSEETDF